MNENHETSQNLLDKVLQLVNRLKKANIYCKLAQNQEDAITIEVVVPGQRWEIDFYTSGIIDVEIFKSGGSIRDESAIDELFRDFSD